MNCEILRTLYMKSNGDILCNDDYGERIRLGRGTADADWSADALFANRQYQSIRDSFARGRAPWPGVCEHCALLRRDEDYSDRLATKRIVKFQIEPSLACDLVCPCCSNREQVRTRPKPFLMPLPMFRGVLGSLRREGYAVDSIEYCGQGEPLMHPQFPSFVGTAREIFPDAVQRVITNGNFDYGTATGGEFIDEILVSCDGVWQRNYERYRVRGDVSLALQFMRDVPARVGGRGQHLVWKYILFEFNDGDDELLDAQELAQELGVGTLLFVVTHSQFHSQRYKLETVGALPIVYDNVRVNAHPAFYDGARVGRAIPRTASWSGHGRRTYDVQVDDIRCFCPDFVVLSGWVAGARMVDRVEVYCNEERLGSAVPRSSRTGAKGPTRNRALFGVSGRLERDLPSEARLRLELFSDGERLGAVERSYRLEPHIDLVPLDLPRPIMAMRNYLRRSRNPALYSAAKSSRDFLLKVRRHLS